jgi:hypothetical protein
MKKPILGTDKYKSLIDKNKKAFITNLKYKDEYNEMRSRQRDAKRGYVVNDSVHRRRDEPHPNPNVKIVVRKVMTATEKRRRKIELELEKVERRRAQWIKDHESGAERQS